MQTHTSDVSNLPLVGGYGGKEIEVNFTALIIGGILIALLVFVFYVYPGVTLLFRHFW